MKQNCKEHLTSFVEKARNPLVVVLGPTASGKTAFSITVAQFLREMGKSAEVVNADSRQLYRGMDIGTAKITSEEMVGIPHHLLDVLDPDEEVTGAWYKVEASRVIDDILKRGNIPMLVGGSMLYISALIDDLEFVSSADPALRQKLEDQYDEDAGGALYARLTEIDPETASAFSKNNKPYVLRAMEIFESTGLKPSIAKQSGSCPWDLLIFGMQCPRDVLVQRIHERTTTMFEDGWIDEVRVLLGNGYSLADPGMKSHGYREIAEAVLDREINEEALAESIAAKTRQYAKRQMTWWRNDPRITWLDASAL